jgi:ABC-type multidrug transport system ATPase subunit
MSERIETDDPGDGVDNESVLRVDGVSQSFGDVEVLADVSFDAAAGELTAVVGPNGSGKTTLSRIVAGLANPDEGSVTIRSNVERPVGFLPQTPGFRPMLTVAETVEFYADLLTTSDGVSTDDSLERVGLGDVPDRRVDALSGGMRRLLGLAIAFLGTPPLVVLDEPTSGLDPRMTRQFFEVAQRLADEGMAVVVTTHDLTYAADADQVVVLNLGRVVASDTPTQLLDSTNADSFTDAFLSVVGTHPTVQGGTEASS